ncbi:glycosyltransferase 87 family protein [Corynebacterium jeikeium]|uniref:glycosyltransferase 87 family protein n=1 Tax=Corynebacterium jeikeium TaxID=38289 RepID=UPI001E3202F9|nr:glycosyltransferase 87 family protein [Corynebacterium jeikeium]
MPRLENFRHLKFSLPVKIALSVLLVLSVLPKIFNSRGFHYNLDLDVYRVGAQRVLDGQELYSGHFHIIGDTYLPFTYPPISAVLFTPLAVMPYHLAAVLLVCATVAVTWWVLAHTVHSAARLDRSSAGWVSVVLTAVLIHLSPIHTTLAYGQINVLLMGMVFADALVVPRRYRGLLTGAAVAIKLTPAVFGLWFLLRKDWGSILRMGAGTVGTTALAWLILPRDSLEYWTHTLRETGRIGNHEYALNQSINGLLYRFGLRTDDSSSLLWVLLVCVSLAVIAFIMIKLMQVQAPIVALCVNSLFALLASPVSWNHHWSWAPVLLVALACYAIANPTSPLASPRWLWVSLVVLGFAAFAFEPTAFVPFQEQRELEWNAWQALLGNSYLWWTILALLVMAIRLALYRDKTPASGASSAA